LNPGLVIQPSATTSTNHHVKKMSVLRLKDTIVVEAHRRRLVGNIVIRSMVPLMYIRGAVAAAAAAAALAAAAVALTTQVS
jgi:hypothetical protein